MYQLTIPIIPIEGNTYLVGSQKLSLELREENLLCKVNGGYENFGNYASKHQDTFQRALVLFMNKSGESLEWVTEQLIRGKRIKKQLQKTRL